MGMPEEFDNWEAENETEFERFVDWYTEPISIINPTKTDYYQYR